MHCLLSTIQQGEAQQLLQSCRTAVHGAGRDGDSGASLTDLKCAVLHTQACKRSSQASNQPQQGSQSASASGEVHEPPCVLLPGRVHEPPCVLPPWPATLEPPLPYLWVVSTVNGCEAQLWVSLKSTQRKRTQLYSPCTHSCCSAETLAP